MLVKAFFASSVAASHLKWLLKWQITYQALKIFGDCFHKGGQYKFLCEFRRIQQPPELLELNCDEIYKNVTNDSKCQSNAISHDFVKDK